MSRDVALRYIEFQVGSLVVSGKGVPSASVVFDNEIGRTSVGVVVPLSDAVEQWVINIVDNAEMGYKRDFRLIAESDDQTAQMIFSGNGSVHAHPFRRHEIATFTIVDIPYLHKKAVDLTSQ